VKRNLLVHHYVPEEESEEPVEEVAPSKGSEVSSDIKDALEGDPWLRRKSE